MKRKFRLIGLIICLINISVSLLACDPPAPIRVENQTNQTLTIFVNNIQIGDVKPSSELKIETLTDIYSTYSIDAKNAEAATVFSQKYTHDELVNMHWIVIIHKVS
jgi:hypothetical protein